MFKDKKKKPGAKEKHIQAVMKKTGWDYEYAVEQIQDARKRLDITYKDYNICKMYEVPIEEQEAEYQKVLNRRARRKQRRERAIASIMKKSGWSREYTIEQVEEAKKSFGITYLDYNKYNFHKVAKEEQEAKYNKILEKKKKKEILEKEKEEILASVMKKTGWEHDKAKQQIESASQRTGCVWKEYLLYKFYELTEEEQEKVFLMDLSKKLGNKYDVDREFRSMLRNKEKTNLYFDEYMKRPWCVNNKIKFHEFKKKFAKSKRIIYKPINGNCGRGVEAFEVGFFKMWTMYHKLKKYQEGVVEEYVVQHRDISAISPYAVNTVRIVSMSSNSFKVTDSGEKKDIAYVALRIGGADAVVDNFHSGGMVACVDKNTGEVVTDAVDMEGQVYKVHPATKKEIRGFKIPFFQESVSMVLEAIEKHQIEGYLGWDIAITENGPVLIEVNTMPAVALLSAPYVPEKKGMKDLMEKYL